MGVGRRWEIRLEAYYLSQVQLGLCIKKNMVKIISGAILENQKLNLKLDI